MTYRVIAVALVLLAVSAAEAQVVQQLTDLVRTDTTLAALDDAGTVAFAISNTDPYGTNPGHLFQIFRWDPATGDGAQVTSFSSGVNYNQWGPSVSDDGTLLVFTSCSDLTGGNPDGSAELFTMLADGTGKVQLTDTASDDDGTIWLYALSGDGSRVVFSSDADYLGTNTQRAVQVWVVDADGTDLAQLTSAAVSAGYWPTISDNGQRIAFAGSEDLTGSGDPMPQIFVMLADGTGLQQLTSLNGYMEYAQISGDGSTITFMTTAPLPGVPGGCNGDQIAVMNWDGSGLARVAAPCIGASAGGYVNPPYITDDGQVIFYAAFGFGLDFTINYEVYSVNKDGTGWTQLTDTDDGPGPPSDCWSSRAAGGGGRVVFFCRDGEPYGGPNPDLSNELFAMTGTGTSHLQLSDGLDGDSWDPDITPDGSRIVFASDANPANNTGYWLPQIYRMAPDGSDVVQITSLTEETLMQPSVTDDGGTIVFTHDGDPLGSNAWHADQIFIVGADGSGLAQLTPYVEGDMPSDEPHISGDGSVVVFRSRANLLGDDPSGYSDIYKIEPDGTNLARRTPVDSQHAWHPRVDATGSWMVYVHGDDIHWRAVDGPGDILVSSSGDWPDISGDGVLVVYSSTADPLGTNPEGNEELYLWNAQTRVTTQMTTTASGSNRRPRFSGNRLYVYFYSDAPHFGENHAGSADQFRVALASRVIERVGGLGLYGDEMSDLPYPISVDLTGRRAVYASEGNSAGMNNDWTMEIFAIDRLAPTRIRVSPGPAPTTVEWDVESGPVRYDVIRGDVASLGIDSGNVDLGAVVCVEDDSIDASTTGSEDLDTPVSGQVFFYLYRGTQGGADGPGSYGTGSGNEERVAASGGCGG